MRPAKKSSLSFILFNVPSTAQQSLFTMNPMPCSQSRLYSQPALLPAKTKKSPAHRLKNGGLFG
jgi:hypothetical protein